MKKLILVSFLATTVLLTSCKDDDSETMDDNNNSLDYTSQIMSPSSDDKKVGDKIDLNILFESDSGETLHHAKVKIYNKADNSIVVYDQPDEAHVHETDGKFELVDEFVLSEANGVEGHTDWVLEAKAWGHDAGMGEVTKTVEFHVHPQ